MQMVKKAALFILLFWVALIVFMPKEELYFSLEKVLAKQGIEINEAKISEGMFSLDLQELTIYAKGIKVATVQEIQCFTLLFYTKITMDNISVDKALSSMIPVKLEKVQLTHSILLPMKVALTGEGDFGQVTGSIDLSERKIHIDFEKSEKLGSLRRQLKKGEEGWYYEINY
jgi:hypothetical protein